MGAALAEESHTLVLHPQAASGHSQIELQSVWTG